MNGMDERSLSESGAPNNTGNGIGRRNFLNGIAGAALSLAAVGAAAVTVEYLAPNVLFEPPTSFRIGPPENYPPNSVTLILEQHVYVVRVPAGFRALSAICTHLGCITRWNPDIDLIACPCHGSRFNMDGSVVRGPAPRPLPHFAMRLMPDGDLMINKLETVPQNQILKV
jgi:cytochrome b6-f complex iron-sulfur subunit